MAAPIERFIKLRDIVYSYNEESKTNEAEFLRLWRLAFRGFKKMGLTFFWQPVTEKLTVNSNKTATLPAACVRWIKIGQLNGLGEFQTLAINKSLTSYRDNNPARINDIASEIPGQLNSPYWFTEGFYGNQYTGEFNPEPNFGAGSHLLQPGECNVDDVTRTIVLNTNYQYPHVYIMFIPAPEQNMDYEIPMEFEEAMIAFLAWKDISNRPMTSHFGNNNITMRARTFDAELKLAIKNFRPFSLAEAEQYYRESFLWGVKG